jgi:uncharacterized protein (TIGR02145 family)
MEKLETIQIGDQIWSAKNLNKLTFANGDKVTLATSLKEWKKLNISKTPACCYYEFDEKKFGHGGLLYNYFAIADNRGLAPEGYRIPSDKDWKTLVDFCGKKKLAGEALKSKNGWESFSLPDGNGKDTHGFSAIAIGYLNNRFGTDLEFMNFEYITVFWTNTLKKGTTNEVYYWQLNSGNSVERDATAIDKDIMALSLRIIKI